MAFMKWPVALAAAMLGTTMPAPAATIILHPEGEWHNAGLSLPLGLGTGVYHARLMVDRPLAEGSVLTIIHNLSYDFLGVSDGTWYGGNDVPAYWDYPIQGSTLSRIIRVDRPYRISAGFWGDEIGYVDEVGFYYADVLLGDFYFASNDPVRLDVSIERISAVPEPSGWAMLITGFAVIGAALRVRRGGKGLFAVVQQKS